MEEALSQAEGLLCVRTFQEGNGGMQLQYWRSHDDLARFARQMPHMAWCNQDSEPGRIVVYLTGAELR